MWLAKQRNYFFHNKSTPFWDIRFSEFEIHVNIQILYSRKISSFDKKNGEKNVSKSPARRANEIRTNPAKQAGETKERPLGNRKGRQGAIANPFLFAFISILSPENKKYPFVLRAGQQPDRRQSQ